MDFTTRPYRNSLQADRHILHVTLRDTALPVNHLLYRALKPQGSATTMPCTLHKLLSMAVTYGRLLPLLLPQLL